MKYKRCSNCGEVKANGYDEEKDICLLNCRICGSDISLDPESDTPDYFDEYEKEMISNIKATFSLVWEKYNDVISIPDNGEKVFIGREYQDFWKKNDSYGLNISRKHIVASYLPPGIIGRDRQGVKITELGSTNGTKVNGVEIFMEDGSNGVYALEGDKITLDAIGDDAIELVVKRNLK